MSMPDWQVGKGPGEIEKQERERFARGFIIKILIPHVRQLKVEETLSKDGLDMLLSNFQIANGDIAATVDMGMIQWQAFSISLLSSESIKKYYEDRYTIPDFEKLLKRTINILLNYNTE